MRASAGRNFGEEDGSIPRIDPRGQGPLCIFFRPIGKFSSLLYKTASDLGSNHVADVDGIQKSDGMETFPRLCKYPDRRSLPLFSIQTLKYHGLVTRPVLRLGRLALMRLGLATMGPWSAMILTRMNHYCFT